MTFMEMAQNRYSVKSFSSKPVEKEKLDAVLEAARIAPTAKDAQSIRIYVLQSKDAVEKAKQLTPCTYGASTVLMFAYDTTEEYHYPSSSHTSGEEDCSIAAVHVMLEAAELGLGTCWVNNFTPEKAEEVFNLPENQKVVLLMPLGYASTTAKPLPNHAKRKTIDQIVKVL